MRLISGRRVFLAFILSFIASVLAAAQDFPLTFASHETLESKILGEKRDILVSAPAHTVPGMPLLILLHGEWNLRNVSAAVAHLTANGRLPPTVVAGGREYRSWSRSHAHHCRRSFCGRRVGPFSFFPGRRTHTQNCCRIFSWELSNPGRPLECG